MIGCKKCPLQYKGETEGMIRERFAEHRGYVNTKNESKRTGAPFNTRGHSTSDMEITVLENIFNQDGQFRKQWEKLWIQKFNTRY